MQRRILTYLCLLIVIFATQRASAASTRETVQKLLDDLAAPMGGAISSGVLGPPGTLGGMPHFSLGVGASLYPVEYEDPYDQEAETIPLGFPSVQARIGIFKGVKLGALDGVGAIDLGGKYGYLPIGGIIKEQPTLTGVELRVGILKDSLTTPSIAVSVTSNHLSGIAMEDEDWKVDIGASTFGAKLLVGKKLPIIHPYGGLGYDSYTIKVDYEIEPPVNIKEEWEQSPSVFRMLVGCEFSVLPFVKLSGEYNSLGDDSAYTFCLRTGF